LTPDPKSSRIAKHFLPKRKSSLAGHSKKEGGLT